LFAINVSIANAMVAHLVTFRPYGSSIYVRHDSRDTIDAYATKKDDLTADDTVYYISGTDTERASDSKTDTRKVNYEGLWYTSREIVHYRGHYDC